MNDSTTTLVHSYDEVKDFLLGLNSNSKQKDVLKRASSVFSKAIKKDGMIVYLIDNILGYMSEEVLSTLLWTLDELDFNTPVGVQLTFDRDSGKEVLDLTVMDMSDEYELDLFLSEFTANGKNTSAFQSILNHTPWLKQITELKTPLTEETIEVYDVAKLDLNKRYVVNNSTARVILWFTYFICEGFLSEFKGATGTYEDLDESTKDQIRKDFPHLFDEPDTTEEANEVEEPNQVRTRSMSVEEENKLVGEMIEHFSNATYAHETIAPSTDYPYTGIPGVDYYTVDDMEEKTKLANDLATIFDNIKSILEESANDPDDFKEYREALGKSSNSVKALASNRNIAPLILDGSNIINLDNFIVFTTLRIADILHKGIDHIGAWIIRPFGDPQAIKDIIVNLEKLRLVLMDQMAWLKQSMQREHFEDLSECVKLLDTAFTKARTGFKLRLSKNEENPRFTDVRLNPEKDKVFEEAPDGSIIASKPAYAVDDGIEVTPPSSRSMSDIETKDEVFIKQYPKPGLDKYVQGSRPHPVTPNQLKAERGYKLVIGFALLMFILFLIFIYVVS